MSNNNHKLVILLLSLVVIFAILGWIVSFKLNEQAIMDQESNSVSEQLTLIQVMEERPVESKNKVIVTDRFVGDLDKDSVIVAISSNGDAYNVKAGALLTDGMVIKSSNEEYSIYRVDSPEKSVSTN